ncbi:A-kinase anchor protein 9 isoform X3 [Lepisosteus oculatus]|uniref:A-kinase anchor protein 9 isoform X3 n=1 Tax=Lepisosteus oculatus TaxID=7918 RepID=UPI0035F52BED
MFRINFAKLCSITLAEYRQRKAQADGQKKTKKKKRPAGAKDGEPSRAEERGEAGAHSADPTVSRSLRSGDTIRQDQTYTIEPESEVSTTADDYTSEVNGCLEVAVNTVESKDFIREEEVHVSASHSEHEAHSSQTRLQIMEDELAAKQQAVEELSRELEEMRAAYGSEGLQQLQEFEAAIKQRDGIITQLTANLQQARKEKDEIMREFLELTDQSQKLQIQFQQLQAGETLRNTSHSSTAADLLQAKQQILMYQQQTEEKDLQLKGCQRKNDEQQMQISQLQERVKETEMLSSKQDESFTQRLREQEKLIAGQQKQITEHEVTVTRLKEELSISEKSLQDLMKQLVEKQQELETFQNELTSSKQREKMSSDEIKQLMGTVEELQKRNHRGNQAESEIVQRMKGDMERKMDQLQAEMDEMYGQQIVQMKQELRKQHLEEINRLTAQHRSELKVLSLQSSENGADVEQINLLNMKIIELQQKLKEAQMQKDKVHQELTQVAEEKLNLQSQVEDLLQDLRFVRGKVQRASQSISDQEHKLSEVGQLHATISDLQTQLTAAAEATKELETKHESEITNYKIKLEMLEREKDAVLDRMAESQEAELDRLRTQLLFSHEEELTNLREDLQRESQVNIESLKDEMSLKHKQVLESMRMSFEEQLHVVKLEKEKLAADREALLSEISQMKDDLNHSLEDPMSKGMALKLEELQTEICELRKEEKEKYSLEREIHELSKKNELLEKETKEREVTLGQKIKKLESEKNYLEETNEAMRQKMKSVDLDFDIKDNSSALSSDIAVLPSRMHQQIESLTLENKKLSKQITELKENLERQTNTFSFAERNFEVNYQELKDEYTCLVKVKAELEDRLLKEAGEHETELNHLRSQVQLLQAGKEQLGGTVEVSQVRNTEDFIDGGEVVEKDTTELMEKLEIAQREKKELSLRLSEASEQLNLKQNEIEQLKDELMSVTDINKQILASYEDLRRGQGAQGKTAGQRQEQQTWEIVQTTAVTTDQATGRELCTHANHLHQIEAFEKKVIALQSSLQTTVLERDHIQEQQSALAHENETLSAELQELRGKPVAETPVAAALRADRDQLQQQLDALRAKQLGLAELVQQKALQEESLHKKLEEKERALTAAEQEIVALNERLRTRQLSGGEGETCPGKRDEEKVAGSTLKQDEKYLVDHEVHTRDEQITHRTADQAEMDQKQVLLNDELRLQMEAQRISLSQICAAQLELLRESLLAEKEACLHSLEESLVGRHAQEVQQLHEKHQQELQHLKEQKADYEAESRSSKHQRFISMVSEECTQLILSLSKVLGEDYLVPLQFKETAEPKSAEKPGERKTEDPGSLLQEAKELYTSLHMLKDRILQECNRLTELQSLLTSDCNKLEELQTAYDELRHQSEKEIASLRMQIDSSRASSQDLNDLKEQLKGRSAHLEEVEKLKTEFHQRQAQLEEQHLQEIERLRVYYQQQARDLEDRYTTELVLLQQRLQEAQCGISSEAQLFEQKEMQSIEELKLDDIELEVALNYPLKSVGLTHQLQTLRKALYAKYVQEVSALKEQHRGELELLALRLSKQQALQEEVSDSGPESLKGGVRSIEGPDTEEDLIRNIQELEKRHKERTEEEVAKVIVQMSVEFAQQTELARLNKQARETTTKMQTLAGDPDGEGEAEMDPSSEEPGLALEQKNKDSERRLLEEKAALSKQLQEKTAEILTLTKQLQQTRGAPLMLDKEGQFSDTEGGSPKHPEDTGIILPLESVITQEPVLPESKVATAGLAEDQCQNQKQEHLQAAQALRVAHTQPLDRQQEEQVSCRAELDSWGTQLDQAKARREGPETVRQEGYGPALQSRSTQTEQNEEENKQGDEEKKTDPETSAEGPGKTEHPAPDGDTTERNVLRRANERLRQVLRDVLKTTAAAEETIGRHVEGLLDASGRGQPQLRSAAGPGGDASSESCYGSEAGRGDGSVWSGETEEGLEMSQRLTDGLFQGADLQLENEECLMSISSRLQGAVEKLLEAITETTNQLEHAKVTQTELMRESFRHNAEISELVRQQEELQERLDEEAKAKEQLALELHRAEGLIDGYTEEKAAMEEQVRQKEELLQHLEQELRVTGSRLLELEQERQQMQQERELLSRQQAAMRDAAGPRELCLVDAGLTDAAPEAGLLEETEKLMKEKVEVQRQAEKESGDLLQQVKALEVELEEQVNRAVELEQAKAAESADLRQQIQALEKQLEKNRKFLDEQAIDREHERDVFQQEIQKLEQQLKSPQKLQPSSEQRNRKVEQLTSQLKEKADRCSELLLHVEQLDRDVQERNEEIEKLECRIRELEQALIVSTERLQKVEERKQYASVDAPGEMTLEVQLQTEREALDRKEKEICNLEEQLEQFREELENKNEEVQQLHMQMEIQRKELSTQQQELEHGNTLLKNEVELLKKSHCDSEDVSVEDRVRISNLTKVMEDKDREIALLNEQLFKLQQLENVPDNKEIEEKDELLKELRSEIECLRSEQERLKKKSEDEVEQLNEVIEKLQQELSKIEHKTAEEYLPDSEDPLSQQHLLERILERDYPKGQDEKVCDELSLVKAEFEELKMKMEQTNQELDTLKSDHIVLLEKYDCLLKESSDSSTEKKNEREEELEEIRLKMEQACQELESVKADHLSLLEKHRCLQETISDCSVDKKNGRTMELEEALQEKTAAILVIQAELKALEQSANSRVADLNAKVEDLEVSVEEKDSELRFCRLQVDQTRAEAQTLQRKILQLEDALREKVAAALVSQAQLGAFLQQSKEHTKELYSQIEELQGHPSEHPGQVGRTEESEKTAENFAVKAFSVADPGKKMQMQDHESKEVTRTKLSDLTQKIIDLENELTDVQKDQDLQKQLLLGSEEELEEYEKRLVRLMNLLEQISKWGAEKQETLTKKASGSAGEEADRAAVSQLAQELQEVRAEAAATKEELSSSRERADKLQEELGSSREHADKLQEELSSSREHADKLQEELGSSREHADKLQEELSSSREHTDKLQEELSSSREHTDKLQEELSSSREHADKLQEELSSSTEHTDKLQEELSSSRERADQLQEELSSSREHANKLQEELSSSREHADKLQEELSSSREHTDKLKEELSSSRERADKLQEELSSSRERADKLQEELSSSRERADKLKEELSSSRERADKLQEELSSSREHADKLQEELSSSRERADKLQEELSSSRERADKLQEELQARELTIKHLQEDLRKASGSAGEEADRAAVSQLAQELQEVRAEAAAMKEELSSSRERADKLQEELQVRDLSVAQLQEDLQRVKEALAGSERELALHTVNKEAGAPEGELDFISDKNNGTITKDKASLPRRSSASQTDKPVVVNGSVQTLPVACRDAEVQADLVKPGAARSEDIAEVISQYTEKIGQMQDLHAAEIMDMETRHISESETLKRDLEMLREECQALNALVDKLRTAEGIISSRLEHPVTSQFKDGYTSDSSSDWSQRLGYDIGSQNQEFRSTPEGARRDNEVRQLAEDMLPDKIKSLLREVHKEGMQVLSLSELPFSDVEPTGAGEPSQSWQRERDALLAAVESLKTLITTMQAHRGPEPLAGNIAAEQSADWRGELLHAVQQVFLKERGVLTSALKTHLEMLDTSDIVVHLNQLECRLDEQDTRHREAMEFLQGADRQSLLTDVRQLQAQLHSTQPGQSRRETDGQSLLASGGHAQNQQAAEGKEALLSERMVLADLKNELAQTRLELETTLAAQHKRLKELEALRTEVSEKAAEVDRLNDALAEEQRKARELQWAFEKEKCKSERTKERENEELEDLKLALADQKHRVGQLAESLEQEREAAESERARQQARLTHEQGRVAELQVQLESEKARAQELSGALERERGLHSRRRQQQSPQRRAEEEEEEEEGEQRVEELLADLQRQLDEKHSRIAQLVGDVERHKLEAAQVGQQWDEERRSQRLAAQREREALQLAQDKLQQLQGKAQELQRQLDRERQQVLRLQQERDRLGDSVRDLQDTARLSEAARDSAQPQHPDARAQNPWKADLQPSDRTRDWVLQQKMSEVLTAGSSSLPLKEGAASQAAPTDSRLLDSVIPKLQLIASKIRSLASKASSSVPFEELDSESLVWLLNSVQDVVSQLQQLPPVPPVPESPPVPSGDPSSSLAERLLRQNAELTGFVSRLTEEKNDLRNALIKLEEELRRYRHRGLAGGDCTNRSPADNQDAIDAILVSDREAWNREKASLEKSLQQAEAEVSRLRSELRTDSLCRDMAGSDSDSTALKRIYGKYLRAESFRKALIYQKKYLLLLLGGFQECEEATLSLIARMGGRPSYTNLEVITHHRRGFTRFRSVVRVSIALSRMKFLVRRWQRATGSGSSPASSVNRNGFGQITGNEVRTDSPYLHPEVYGERRASSRGRSGRESPRSTLSVHHRYQTTADAPGSLACSHLQNYDPDRALTDYISRLEALQRRLGSVQSGSTSYAPLHYGIRR